MKKHSVRYPVYMLVLLLVTSCIPISRNKPVVVTQISTYPNSTVHSQVIPAPSQESPDASPTSPSPTLLAGKGGADEKIIPYYDRNYRLLHGCNGGECLFYDDLSHPIYPLGYSRLYGYYLPIERTRIRSQGAEREKCDGFVITSGVSELLQAYDDQFSGDEAVLSKTSEGNLVINIPLWNEDEDTKEIIYSSTVDSPVMLYIINEPPGLRGSVSCFSPVYVISAYKPISPSELSDTYIITESDNGKTFKYRITSRFIVSLDDENHPRPMLVCEPEPIFGYISNGSNQDVARYPVQFEITKTGECLLKNGDFQVTIIGLPLK